jgi:hypothetical protein
MGWQSIGWLFRVLCALVGGLFAYAFGESLVSDAYFASREGQARFFDVASRLAVPFIEVGVIAGLVVTTATYTRDPRRVLRNLNAVLWLCFLINLAMFYWDHPLRLIGF